MFNNDEKGNVMNLVIDTLKSHTSVRKFNDKPISEELQDTIIDCARRGATAGNMQMYHIIRIADRTLLTQLGETCDHQPFIGNAAFALLFVVDNHKWDMYFRSEGVPQAFEDYKGPQIADLFLGMQDTMIAAQNAVIAAESMGIGTCYIGDIMEQAEKHRTLFNLPQHTMPATLVVFGYYDMKPQLRERFDKSVMVTDNQYIDINDDIIKKLFSDKPEGFAKAFYKRKINADFFKEMCRSIKVFMKDWL